MSLSDQSGKAHAPDQSERDGDVHDDDVSHWEDSGKTGTREPR
jgi:hypothetical protein